VEFEKYSTIPRKVEIVDMLGRLQLQFETADQRNLLHLQNLESGIYLLRIDGRVRNKFSVLR
jgi:hypothetical protein